LALAFGQSGLARVLVEVFGGVRYGIGQLPSIAKRTDLFVGHKKRFVALVDVGLVLGAVQILAPHAVTEGDTRVQLRTVEQGVRSITDTRRVVVALVVVGECTPFRADVDVTLCQYQSTRSADHVSTRVVLDEVWWVFATLVTDHPHIQVLAPFVILLLLFRRLYDLTR
jgi:hypothetical protein